MQVRPFRSTPEAASMIGHKPQTLCNWRSLGIGPEYVKLPSGRVVYFESELRRWMESGYIAPELRTERV